MCLFVVFICFEYRAKVCGEGRMIKYTGEHNHSLYTIYYVYI